MTGSSSLVLMRPVLRKALNVSVPSRFSLSPVTALAHGAGAVPLACMLCMCACMRPPPPSLTPAASNAGARGVAARGPQLIPDGVSPGVVAGLCERPVCCRHHVWAPRLFCEHGRQDMGPLPAHFRPSPPSVRPGESQACRGRGVRCVRCKGSG